MPISSPAASRKITKSKPRNNICKVNKGNRKIKRPRGSMKSQRVLSILNLMKSLIIEAPKVQVNPKSIARKARTWTCQDQRNI